MQQLNINYSPLTVYMTLREWHAIKNDSKKSQSLKSNILYIVNKEDLKGYSFNVIISPGDMHTIKLNHIKYQDLNIINVINSVIIFRDSRWATSSTASKHAHRIIKLYSCKHHIKLPHLFYTSARRELMLPLHLTEKVLILCKARTLHY